MKNITTLFFLITIVLSNAQDLTKNYRKLILNSPNSISLFQSSSTSGIWASGMVSGDRWGIFEDATSSKEWLTVLPGGNVGIGTSIPERKLHILQDEDPNGDQAIMITEPNNSQKILLHLADNLNGEYGYLYLGGSTSLRGNGESSYFDGNVGIGTTSPDAKLAVNGNIHAKEVKVDLIGWPDYVFKENYDLPTLEEVERYIQEKGHLINIPSAEEVEANGFELGQMNKLLLEKIEELTLYILELDEKLKKTSELNERLEKTREIK